MDPEGLERARELAQRGVGLDDTLTDGHRLLAQVDLWKKDHDAAIAHAKRSLAIAPNDADGYETLSEVLGWAGQAEESLRAIRQAMRLNPRYPFFYLWSLGHAQFVAGRRQEALDTLRKLVEVNPNFMPGHAYLAVLLGELGRLDEARAAWDRASHLSPGASLDVLRQRLPYRRPADLERFLTAARKRGME
jgi:tetratricopeptide (TPR) repeat protein